MISNVNVSDQGTYTCEAEVEGESGLLVSETQTYCSKSNTQLLCMHVVH